MAETSGTATESSIADVERDVKPRRCSTCKGPVKGHSGQIGKYCTNPPLSEHEEEKDKSSIPCHESEEVNETAHKQDGVKSTKTDSSSLVTLMQQLCHQITSLNTNVESMVAEQAAIMSTLRQDSGYGTQPNSLASSSLQHGVGATAAAPHVSTSTAYESTYRPRPTAGNDSAKSGCLPSDKVVKAAMNGEFISLVDFLPSNEPIIAEQWEAPTEMPDGVLYVRPKKSRRTIDNFDSWLAAWTNYESLMVGQYPELYPNFVTHRQLIQTCNRKYNWQSICMYDIRHRMRLGAQKSFAFERIDNDLFVTILDSTAIKSDALRCFRCKSFEHVVSNCPFPAEAQVEANKKAVRAKPGQKPLLKSERWYHNGKEGCNNWQRDRCNVQQCPRAHVCKGCRGPEPHDRCPTCNKL